MLGRARMVGLTAAIGCAPVVGLAAAIGCAPVVAPAPTPEPARLVDPAVLRDRDGDGVIDSLDGCVDLPGGTPGRGCPLHDADPEPDRGVAIAAADRCPDAPETVNGFQDDDGCPDVVPMRLTGRAETAVVLRMNGQEIDPAAIARADQTIRDMLAHPEIRLEVAGHADNREGRGDAEEQRDIGMARAVAVRDYLVRKGAIDPRRVSVRSAGSDEPVDSNLSAAGRAKNRRVVITIIH